MAVSHYMRAVAERTFYYTCYRAAMHALFHDSRKEEAAGQRNDVGFFYYGLFGMRAANRVRLAAYDDAFWDFVLCEYKRAARRYYKAEYALAMARMKNQPVPEKERRAADSSSNAVAMVLSEKTIKAMARSAWKNARRDFQIQTSLPARK